MNIREPRISVITPTIRGQDALIPVIESLKKQTFKDFEWIPEFGNPNVSDLNAAFNRLIRQSRGELIVFLEDFTKIQPNGLSKFWEAYQKEPKFYTAPVGKTKDWKNVEWDWRTSEVAQMDWRMWEIDWACAPKKALYDIGGFDEDLDRGWGFDNVSVGYRAYLKGYKFECLKDNPAIAYVHEVAPLRHKQDPDLLNIRLDLIKHGLIINYLE